MLVSSVTLCLSAFLNIDTLHHNQGQIWSSLNELCSCKDIVTPPSWFDSVSDIFEAVKNKMFRLTKLYSSLLQQYSTSIIQLITLFQLHWMQCKINMKFEHFVVQLNIWQFKCLTMRSVNICRRCNNAGLLTKMYKQNYFIVVLFVIHINERKPKKLVFNSN